MSKTALSPLELRPTTNGMKLTVRLPNQQFHAEVEFDDQGQIVCGAARIGPAGLGDRIAKMTRRLGIKGCGGCKGRQKKLNKLFPSRKS